MYKIYIGGTKLLILLAVLWVGFSASQANAKIDPATIVGMWLFDENGGDVATDSSPAGNDGTIVGPKKWADGKFGKALEFNGINVYVEVQSNKSIVLEELTVMGWAKLKPSQGTRWQSIMMKGQNPRNYLLVVDKDTQKLQLSITKGAPDQWAGPIAGPVVTDGKWHHLVGVIGQKAGLVVYADGIEVGKQGYAKPSLDAKPDRLRIGDGSDGGHQADGLLDEVALFNVPLDAADIVKIMNDGLEAATGLRPVEAQDKLATTWGRLKSDR
jgi:hypothetical protein